MKKILCALLAAIMLLDAQIVQIIDEGTSAFLCELGAEILLAESHIVRHGFQHQFRVGEIVPHEIPGDLRIKRAQELLVQTDMKIYEICP